MLDPAHALSSQATLSVDCVEKVSSQSGKKRDRIRQRARKMRVRVRYGQREIKHISRTATLGGLFLSFLKIGLVGFGGGLTWGALAAEWTGPIPSKGHVNPEQYRRFARLRSLVRRGLRFIEGLLYRREL